MQTIKSLLPKKVPTNNGRKSRLVGQFQEISLELAEKFKVTPKEKRILFAFVKIKMDKGQWWKIKEVTEYMESKGITSMRYFMACFKQKNEQRQDKNDS